MSQSAIDRLLADPMIRRWRRDEADRRVPFLSYYRRSYSTAHDGIVTEHGDGFCLTFVDSDDPDAMQGLVTVSVPVTSAFDECLDGRVTRRDALGKRLPNFIEQP